MYGDQGGCRGSGGVDGVGGVGYREALSVACLMLQCASEKSLGPPVRSLGTSRVYIFIMLWLLLLRRNNIKKLILLPVPFKCL